MRPGVNGTVTSCPAFLRRLLDGRAPAQHDQVGERDLLSAGLRAVEVLLDLLEGRQHLGQLGRLVDRPSPSAARGGSAPRWPRRACRCRGSSPPTPRRWTTSWEIGQPRLEDLGLEGGDVLVADQLVIDRGDRVLPQLRLGHPRAEVARDGPHVAVQQLVPGLGERLGELVRVLVEALRDRPVDRVDLQREVRRQHHRRVPLRRVVGVRHGALGLGILGRPLLRPGGARRQLPVVAEQVVQVPVVPLGRLVGPGALQPAGERVGRPCRCRSCSSSRGPAARAAQPRAPDRCTSGRRRRGVLPNVWPPTMSATVSSSFIAIRPKVSRMSRADASGSGLPFGPSGFT